jgi:hypothetical protein
VLWLPPPQKVSPPSDTDRLRDEVLRERLLGLGERSPPRGSRTLRKRGFLPFCRPEGEGVDERGVLRIQEGNASR